MQNRPPFSYTPFTQPNEPFHTGGPSGYSPCPLPAILQSRAPAVAFIEGSSEFPEISGMVQFYQTVAGVILYAEITGLPKADTPCHDRIFGFHIHEGTVCNDDSMDPFSDAMSHFNPEDCSHPYHAGDLPPLFGNNGLAISLFLTNRFSVHDIVGKTVIIHDAPDDFTTQPSGNSGTKIACGTVQWTERTR